MNNYNGYMPTQPNNYYPYTPRQNQYATQTQMGVPTQMAQPNSNVDWIMVPTIQQVDSVTVQPSQKAWIMVQNEPVFALKTADNMGLVSTDYYKFERLIEPNKGAEKEYVTKTEMEEAIQKAIENVRGEYSNEPTVSENKNDQYGGTKESRFPFKNEKFK